MTCRIVAADLVDVARGVGLAADRQARVDRHLRECRRCASRLEEERAMSAALGQLAQAINESAVNLESERAALAAFDAAWTQPKVVARPRAWRPLAAAAALGLAAGVVWMIAGRHVDVHAPDAAPGRVASAHPDPVERPAQPLAPVAQPAPLPAKPAVHRAVAAPRARAVSRDASAFVPWPGADTLPTFESGRLMRLDLPAAVAISLGLTPPASHSSIVRADILVGQDGFARAVRVAP
jgi:hypothetical protein